MNETDTREVHGLWHAVDDAATQRSSPEEGDSPEWQRQRQRCITAKIGGHLEVEDEGNKVISPTFPLANTRNEKNNRRSVYAREIQSC
jgi:hypothetical protein